MARVDRDNCFELTVNFNDPIILKNKYIAYFFDCYDGEFVQKSIQQTNESIFWYKVIELEIGF